MLDAQKYLFWVYYASLMLAVCLKFVDIYFGGQADPAFHGTIFFKVVATAFAFVSSLALLWSATLPTLPREAEHIAFAYVNTADA